MAKKKANKKVAKKVVKKAAPKKAASKTIAFKSTESFEVAFGKHCKSIVKDTMKKFGLTNIAILGNKAGYPSEDQIVTVVAMDGKISEADIGAWGHTVINTFKSRVKAEDEKKKAQEAELDAKTDEKLDTQIASVMEQPIEHAEMSAPPELTEDEEELNDSSDEGFADEEEDDEDFLEDDDDDEDDDNDEGYF